MAVTLKVLKQKRGVTGTTLVAQATMTGDYPGAPGETISLNGGAMSNPAAETVTGPSVALVIPPRLNASLGGYTATLTLTSGLSYDLQFWTSGGTELATAGYPDAIKNGTLTLEMDFGTGSFDS